MTRSKPLHFATFGLFVAVLVAPWVAGLFGASSETVEQRLAAPLPALGGAELLEAETFGDLNLFVRDRTPLRGQATGWVNTFWLQFDASGDRAVVEGPGDVFFLAEDFTRPCDRGYELSEMERAFGEMRDAAAAGEKEWLFLIAPDKGAVLDHRLSGRADIAAGCAREARAEFRSSLDSTNASLDLVPTLIEADIADPGRWYYEHDSHWTFEAGGLVAEDVVDYFEPGLFDPSQIGTIQRALPIRGDAYRRLGIAKTLDVPDPVRASLRDDIVTERVEEQIGGTRTIRTYTNTGSGGVLPGRTIVTHDSMMNFAERQLASYFEEIVFIHWDDLEKANFLGRVTDADRVIMMPVERDAHRIIGSVVLDDSFRTDFAAVLAAERVAPDELLIEDLLAGSEALRAFTRDTGQFAQAFGDLLNNPGADGWAGPYATGEIFERAVHPRYGEWRTVQRSDSPPGSITECAAFNSGDCGTWLLLFGVPDGIVTHLDQHFDGSDGKTAGRIRRTDEFGILYFYSLG